VIATRGECLANGRAIGSTVLLRRDRLGKFLSGRDGCEQGQREY
jgi:hypothetical protein